MRSHIIFLYHKGSYITWQLPVVPVFLGKSIVSWFASCICSFALSYGRGKKHCPENRERTTPLYCHRAKVIRHNCRKSYIDSRYFKFLLLLKDYMLHLVYILMSPKFLIKQNFCLISHQMETYVNFDLRTRMLPFIFK